MLMPPQDPMILEKPADSWTVVNHIEFTGGDEDSFARTTLHLSFTEQEFVRSGLTPTKKNSHNLDDRVLFLESVVSVHDKGMWIADIDILKAIESNYFFRLTVENDRNQHQACLPSGRGLIAVDSWSEVLDMPKDSFIVRANGNWIARLAATAVLSQMLEAIPIDKREFWSIIACPPYVCWRCLELNIPGCYRCSESDSHVGATFKRHVHEVATVFIQ